DRLSSIEALKEFAHDLGSGEAATGAGGEFQRWFTHLCDLKVGRTVRSDLRDDLAHMPHFGAAPALRTYEEIQDRTPINEPFFTWSSHAVQARLDSRPEDLWRWAGIVSGGLCDLVAGERLAAAAVAASHPRDTFRRGWWASFEGDRHTLDSLLAVPFENPMDQVELLH